MNGTGGGTPQYLAPEVWTGTAKLQEAFALDLWALGCIVFYMLAGETPFYRAGSENELADLVVHAGYSYPRLFPRVARHLVDGLLRVSASERLGMGTEGLGEL